MNFLPQIPTDSIYKFAALAGTILCFVYLIWVLNSINAIEIDIIRTKVIINIHSIKQQYLEHRIKEIKVNIAEVENELTKEIETINTARLQEKKKSIDENLKEIVKLQHDEEIQREHVIGANNENGEKIKQLDFFIKSRWIVSLLLIIIASWGWYNWATKIQEPQDKMQKMQLLLLENQVKEMEKQNK